MIGLVIPRDFFDAFPIVDGAFSWESAWPGAGSTAANVSDSVDESLIEQAHVCFSPLLAS